jgi:hypothetical protein
MKLISHRNMHLPAAEFLARRNAGQVSSLNGTNLGVQPVVRKYVEEKTQENQ